MRIAIVQEYLPPHPWRPQWWGVTIAKGLARRGHDLVILCDGAFDDHPYLDADAGAIEVEVRRPGRTDQGPSPIRFPRWAARRARAHRADAVLSLTALMPSGAWLPIERAGEAIARSLQSGPLGLALEIVEQPMLPVAALAESARRPRSSLAIGAPIVGGVALGFASRLEPPDPREARRIRSTTRSALGISDDQVVALVSATSRDTRALRPILHAMAGGRSALLLTAGPRAHTIDHLAREIAPALPTRHAGPVSDMVPVLLGADVVCLPGAREGTGRLAAEALAFGRPIIIAQGAPGSSLVIPHPSGAPGLVVPSVEARTWSDAVTRITDQRWLDKASRAAREAGEELSLSNLLDRLEEQLQP